MLQHDLTCDRQPEPRALACGTGREERSEHLLPLVGRDPFTGIADLDHGLTQLPYVIRRSWDFFVRNLLGVEPPADYTITGPPPGG